MVGETLLFWAKERQDSQIVEFLIKMGANYKEEVSDSEKKYLLNRSNRLLVDCKVVFY